MFVEFGIYGGLVGFVCCFFEGELNDLVKCLIVLFVFGLCGDGEDLIGNFVEFFRSYFV